MDKAGERRAFDAVYGSTERWTVTPTEAPDFLCDRSGTLILGVEVTELWRHQTDARLANIEGYSLSLIDGGDVVHKDDVANIVVDTIKILPADSDQSLFEVSAIIQKLPNAANRVALLLETLASKSAKVAAYSRRCPVLDLVVHDQSMLFWFEDFEQLIRPFSMHAGRDKLILSPFREIHLLTRMGGAHVDVRIPLKTSLLMEDLLVLEELIVTNGAHGELHESPRAVEILFAGLRNLGHRTIRRCVEDGCLGLSIGCHTVHWTSDGTILRDYSSIPEQVPLELYTGLERTLSVEETQLARAIAESRPAHHACLPLALPTKGT